MAEGTKLTVEPGDREIVVSRVLDAPRELVWEAWTDPVQVVKWWGPNGFTTTTYKMEVRVGGVWRFVMHGPDGRDYQNKIVFLELVKPERIVYEHPGDGEVEPVCFRTEVTFEEEANGGKTKVTMRMMFPSTEERDRVGKEYGAIEGAKQHIERLGEHVENG